MDIERLGRPGSSSTYLPRVKWFPSRRDRLERLSFVQATEPGTLHAVVTARFSARNYQSYFPPRVTLQLYPR